MNASKSRQVFIPYDKSISGLYYILKFYQSERFLPIWKDDIRKAFTFNPRLSNRKTKEMSEQIDHDENAVSYMYAGRLPEPKYWKTTGEVVC